MKRMGVMVAVFLSLVAAREVRAASEFAAEIMTATNIVRQTSTVGTNYFMANVGIGTNLPSSKLQVLGNADIVGGLSVSGALSVARQGDVSMGSYTNGQPTGGVSGAFPSGTTGNLMYYNGTRWAAMTNLFIDATTGKLYLNGATNGAYANSSGNLALNGKYLSNDGDDEGVFIQNDGTVFVKGTTNQFSAVVQGSLNATGSIKANNAFNAGGGIAVDLNTTAADSTGIFFYGGNGTVAQFGFINLDITGTTFRVGGVTNGGNYVQFAKVNSSGGWSAGCSKEYKKDIRELDAAGFEGVMADFAKLKVYEYERKDVPGQPEVGVVAEWTSDWIRDPSHDSVNYIRWLGYLTAVAKDQERRLQDQQAQIDELRKMIERRQVK